MQPINKMAGVGGTQFYDGTATLAIQAWAIQINADAVINVLTDMGEDGSSKLNDITGSSDQNITSKTLKSGILLTAAPGKVFDQVSLTSGDIIIHKV